jgi:ankyrin repeat protein
MLRRIFSKVTGKTEQQLLNEALRSAAIKGQTARVRKLIAQGADVNYKDINQCTPLYFAASRGHADVVRKLVECKADLDIKNYRQMTALQTAILSRQEAVALLLIEAGADIDLLNRRPETPLGLAVAMCQREVALRLVEKGADALRLNIRGDDAYTSSKRWGWDDVVAAFDRKRKEQTEAFEAEEFQRQKDIEESIRKSATLQHDLPLLKSPFFKPKPPQ